MAAEGQIEWRGREIAAEVHAAAAQGLRLAGEHLVTESRKLVPLETGALERSGTATVDDGDLEAAVSYDTPYAVPVHEDLTAQHDNGRQAKYLEQALETHQDTLQELIAAQIRRALAG
ncbi:hypothetical protein AB1484_26925 [Parafrankia sp. FMc6]|uniref:hypothetical protein n=1 Tax=Parafrankia soli TaxID=2599596 RepID=UPI0034D4153A